MAVTIDGNRFILLVPYVEYPFGRHMSILHFKDSVVISF
jgi:hypothetical protein